MKFSKLIILLFFTSTVFSQINYSTATKPFIEVTGYSVSKVRSLEKNKAVQFEKIKIASSIYVKFSIK